MAHSNHLRLWEVRQAMRLVGECRDQGRHPRAWLLHAMQGMQQLLKSNVVLGALAGTEGFSLHSRLQLVICTGWASPQLGEKAMAYLATEPQLRDPSFHRLQQIARPNITLRPSRLISRRAFETSDFYADRAGFGIEDQIFSQRQTANRLATFSLAPQRPPGDTWFSVRDRKLLGLFHSELALLAGNVLSDGLADPLAGLTLRLRQTLASLLAGDSEKEAALRLGISRHTVHQYVVALYRHFRVNSRPGLLALCFQRGIGLPGDAGPAGRQP
jgi:DNA-binding CsgD family transcriptional regulator